MSREEVSAFLRNLQLSLDGLQREVESRIRRVGETKREALPELLADCRRQLARFAAEQQAEFDNFAQEAGLELEPAPVAASIGGEEVALCAAEDSAATPYGAVQLKSLERRVASMGGIPALGACVLPRMTPGMRPQLNATASPAAVEIMRGRIGAPEDATPLKKTQQEAEAEHTPLVQLRATPAPAARVAPSPLGGPAHESELAAAIQRRMQRLASASPDKAPGAAAEVACDV